jgi:cyanophycin synthetase
MTPAIRSENFFSGPGIFSQKPVLRLLLDLGPDRNESIGSIAGTGQEMVTLLTTLTPFSGHDPLPPLEDSPDSPLAEKVGLLACNLQRCAGIPVDYFASFETGEPGLSEIIVECIDEVTGQFACRLAVQVIAQQLDPHFDLNIHDHWERFGRVVATTNKGLTSSLLINAARQRGIPVSWLDQRGRIVELGNGIFRKRIAGTVTSRTSLLAAEIERDKSLANAYLRKAGLPVPQGGVARTPEQAIRVADEIGYPVVVKPVDGLSSRGLGLDLRTPEQVRDHIPVALAASRSGGALIERFVRGRRYRVTVVDGRLVSVLEITPPLVVGDGRHSIRDLVAIANTDPRRGQREADPLRPIALDEQVEAFLGSSGRGLDDVPAPGEVVPLGAESHVRDGGLSIDRTDAMHPINCDLFLQAVATVGLDVATIDVVAEDLATPLWENGGAILELNASSAFRLQRYPGEGQPRDPGPAIVEMLFPPGVPVRVPIVAVTGQGDHAGLCERLAERVAAEGLGVGLATSRTLTVGGTRLLQGDDSCFARAGTILNNPATEVAVVEVDPQEIVDRGLAFDYCDVAVVLDPSGLLTPYGTPVESVLTALLPEDGILALGPETTDSSPALSSPAHPLPWTGERSLIDAIAAHIASKPGH